MARHEIGDYALIESRDDGTVVIEHTPTGESIQLDSGGMQAGAGAFDSVDAATLTATNGDISDLGLDSLTQGDNPAETITNTASPKSFTFSGNDSRDIHDSTDVTISNASGASATEDITVSLYEGSDTTGTLLVDETRSITVADATTVSEPFITSNQGLGAGDYHIEITQSGTALSINQTDEHTLGAEFSTADQDTDGTLVTTDQQGRERVRHDPVDNRTEFPGAISASEASIGGLYTRGRSPTAVIRNDAGTIRADGPTGEIASGPDAGAVIQAAHDAQGRPFIWIAEEVNFDSGVTITKNDTWIKGGGTRLVAASVFESFFQVGTGSDYASRVEIDGLFFEGRDNTDFATRLASSQDARFRDNFARGCNIAMLDMSAEATGGNNTHHFTVSGLWGYQIPIGIRMSDDVAVVADGTVRDCYFSGVSEAGIVAENPIQCMFDHIKTSSSDPIDASVKITHTGSIDGRVEGNKLENVHIENNVTTPGAAVLLETTSGSSALAVNTIRDPSAAGGGPIVRLTGPSDGGTIRSTSITGTRSTQPDGDILWDIGERAYWTRIEATNTIGGRDNLSDNGFATVFNGLGERDRGDLGLPAGQWQPGDRVRNTSDGAVYQQLRDGSWDQLKPAGPLNLAGMTGEFDNQEAYDDGTNTAASGLLCVWDATGTQWVASDGTTFV